MSGILFGESYYLRFDPKLWEAMQPYPPLGTLYAAAYLRERGFSVALFDAMLAGSEGEWAEALDRERPQIAVLYEDSFNYLSKMCLLRMRGAAFTMIRAARERGCAVVACGSDATDHAEDYLACGADFVIAGEGEAALGELVDLLTGRSSVPPESIAGLVFRSGDRIIRTPPRPVFAHLDALPFPAWDLVDVPRYRELWVRRHGYYSMNMITTRGCPYHCNWCAKPIWGQRYHARSPENVVAEMAWLASEYRPDHIWFADDIMGLVPGWIGRFADLAMGSGLRIPFKSLHRADLLLQDGVIDALRRAGARTVWMGAESGSQKILDAMGKGTRVEQITEAARRLHLAGIEVCFFLQFGYPGETRADIELTLQMVRSCAPEDIGMSVSYPLPGTRFYEMVRHELGAQQNWVDSSDMAMLYNGPFPTRFYRQLHRVLHKEFRARRTLRTLARAARRPASIEGRLVRQTAAMIYHAATLPIDRWRLDRLSRSPNEKAVTLPALLAPTAAARPTAQVD